MRTIQDLTRRVRAEYLEMPGLRLTADQVRRLCGIEQAICDLVLEELVAAAFLYVTPSGHFGLATGEPVRAQPAKAALRNNASGLRAS